MRTVRLVPIYLCLALMAVGPVAAQTGGRQAPETTGDPGGFKWSWEKGGNQGGAGQMFGELVATNMALTERNKELEKRCSQAEKSRDELNTRVVSMERNVRFLEATVEELRRSVSASPGSDARVRALTTKVDALQNENERLRADLQAAQTEAGETDPGRRDRRTPAPGQNSDLVGRAEKENTELRDRVRTLSADLKKETAARAELSRQLEAHAAETASLRQRVSDLSAENKAYRAGLAKSGATGGRAAGLEVKVAGLEAQVAELESRLKSREKELNALRGRPVSSGQTAEPVGGTEENQVFNAAVEKMRAGMYKDAERAFLKLLSGGSGAADVHYNLGILYDDHLKDKAKAARHYRAFLDLAPDSPDADKVRLWLMELD